MYVGQSEENIREGERFSLNTFPYVLYTVVDTDISMIVEIPVTKFCHSLIDYCTVYYLHCGYKFDCDKNILPIQYTYVP